MVTQVIGDNVARAFSLVGALSIVRFRTVVRDTRGHRVRDLRRRRRHGGRLEPSGRGPGRHRDRRIRRCRDEPSEQAALSDPYRLEVRVGLGHDAEAVLHEALDAHVTTRRLMSMSTARQGMAIEVASASRSKRYTGFDGHALTRRRHRHQSSQVGHMGVQGLVQGRSSVVPEPGPSASKRSGIR